MSRWRRAWWLALLAGAVALTWHSVSVRSGGGGAPSKAIFEEDPPTGAVLVDLEDDASKQVRQRVGTLLRRAIAPESWPSGRAALGQRLSRSAQLFRLEPPASEIDDVMRALADEPGVEGVELERVWHLPPDAARFEGAALDPAHAGAQGRPEPERGPFEPDDPYYKHQWHLDQIQMPYAWTRSRGRGVVVAVVDTGVLSRDHGRFRRAPDLAKTQFVAGRDFVDRDDAPDDEHGHGTHVAGTIAQSTNNALGVAGVAPEAAIMPVRVLDRGGAGRWGAVAAGIRWAADNGADVINLSLGGGMPSQTVRRAVDHARNKGVVVVAAAGNTGRSSVGYPAMHRSVLSVGAVRYDEQLTFYSAHGRGLDMVAPGGDLRVDQNGDGLPDGVLQNTMVRGDPSQHDYLAFQGTSMAAPHVAGAAALLRSAGVRDAGTIERILTRSAKDKHDRRRYGAGLLQADDALRLAHEGLGGLRGVAALGLGLVLMLGLRRRRRLDAPLVASVAVAVAVAGGLGLLPWHWLPGVGFGAAQGVPGWLASVGGPWLAPLVLSAALPLAATALLLGAKRARGLLVGLGVGFAAFLWVEAAVPTATMALLPAAVAGPWLVLNGALAALLARLAATRRPLA